MALAFWLVWTRAAAATKYFAMKILVVDDDPELRDGVSELLARRNIQSEPADSAEWADSLVRTQQFSAIVLDLGLPDGDGLDLLRQWRQRGISTPVIVVSARGAPDDRADGIMAGADDYLAKPYHARELIARLQRMIHGTRNASDFIRFGASSEWAFDPETLQVHGPEGEVSLSITLRRVLAVLVAARKRPISKEVLLDQVSDNDEPATANAAEQWMRRLRSKLGNETIRTLPGLGYQLQWPSN